MFFANEQREKVREDNPGISFGQVGKMLGEKWKNLGDEDRRPYEEKAAADKKRYEEEKATYNVSWRCPPPDSRVLTEQQQQQAAEEDEESS